MKGDTEWLEHVQNSLHPHYSSSNLLSVETSVFIAKSYRIVFDFFSNIPYGKSHVYMNSQRFYQEEEEC